MLLTVWVVLIFVVILISLCIIGLKVFKKIKTDSSENFFLSLMIASIAIFIVYNFIGLFDLTFLVLTGIIGLTILCNYFSGSKRWIVITLILLLLALNLAISLESTAVYDGMRDQTNGHYLNSPSEWYSTYIIKKLDLNPVKIFTDVYTGGYIAQKIANEGYNSNLYPEVLNEGNMISVLTFEKLPDGQYYIINYKLNSVSLKNWVVLSSFTKAKQILNNNINLNIYYDSGSINIFGTF